MGQPLGVRSHRELAENLAQRLNLSQGVRTGLEEIYSPEPPWCSVPRRAGSAGGGGGWPGARPADLRGPTASWPRKPNASTGGRIEAPPNPAPGCQQRCNLTASLSMTEALQVLSYAVSLVFVLLGLFTLRDYL